MSKSKRKNTAAKYWHLVVSGIRSTPKFWEKRIVNQRALAKRRGR